MRAIPRPEPKPNLEHGVSYAVQYTLGMTSSAPWYTPPAPLSEWRLQQAVVMAKVYIWRTGYRARVVKIKNGVIVEKYFAEKLSEDERKRLNEAHAKEPLFE